METTWRERGKEYAILTAEISKATFGIIPSEYKNLKGLTKASEKSKRSHDRFRIDFYNVRGSIYY